MLNNKVSKAVRLAIAFGAASTAAFSANTFAAEETEAEEEKVERIQVTGSRIKRFSEVSPTPVTVFSGADLSDAGITNVGDLLDSTPSADIGTSLTTSQGIFGAGIRTTNLRGLGTGRTLVLVNGKRFVSSSVTSSAVDLNMIPTAVIKRVEITHGGASAVYGSDAMAGVVNIILEDSYDGFSLDALTSRPQQDNGEEDVFSLTFGSENEDNSFIFNATYSKIGQLDGRDRDFIRDTIVTMRNPENDGDKDGIPQFVLAPQKFQGLPQVLAAYDRKGMVTLGEKDYTFGPNGELNPAKIGIGPRPFPNPDSRNYGEDADGYKFLDHTYIAVPLERLNTFTAINKDINDDHSVSFEMAYGKTSSVSNSSPVFLAKPIRVDNPFWGQEARDFFNEQGANPDDVTWITKLGVGGGKRQFYNDQAYFSGTLSVSGVIMDEYDYEVYYNYGRNTEDAHWGGELLEAHLDNALDATLLDGSIVCADRNDKGEVVGAIAGCEPLNLLGQNAASEEALNYVNTDGTQHSVKSQKVLGATLSGTAFELPAGAISFALSGEYREERGERTPGAAMQNNLLFNNFVRAWDGEFDVTELGLEVSIPLLADTFLAEELSLDIAYRAMDYSTVGRNSAYKVGVAWQPIDDIRVRATRSKSVRAPELDDLYNTGTQSFASYSDPCDAVQIEDAEDQFKAALRANCAADGIPVADEWRPSEAWRDITPQSVNGGNPNLQEETSEDTLFGIVYTPTDNLGVIVDYWHYKIEDALTFVGPQTIVNNCYRSSNFATNEYCQLFDRRANLDIIEVKAASANLAYIEMKGVDIEANYKLDTSFGEFKFRAIANYLAENERIDDVNDEQYTFNPTVGEESYPRWKATLSIGYTLDDLYVGLFTKYRHSTVRNRTWTIENNNYNDIRSHTEFDLNARYNISEQLTVRAGINNLFDVTPPRVPGVYDSDEGYYDMYGRTFTAGVNFKF